MGRTGFDHQDCSKDEYHQKQVAETRRKLATEGKPATPSNIVAALMFSYWTTLLSRQYENLWRLHLHKIVKKADGRNLGRKELAVRLDAIRKLRNRVAHHEPIWKQPLTDRYNAIVELAGWLSPDAAKWITKNSRFPEVENKQL